MEIKSPGSRSKEAFPHSLQRGVVSELDLHAAIGTYSTHLTCIDNHIFPFAPLSICLSQIGELSPKLLPVRAPLSDQYHGIHLDRGAIYLDNISSN